MKSLPFANGGDFAAPATREEVEALENGLRLLAKLIAKAIRQLAKNKLPQKLQIYPVKNELGI